MFKQHSIFNHQAQCFTRFTHLLISLAVLLGILSRPLNLAAQSAAITIPAITDQPVIEFGPNGTTEGLTNLGPAHNSELAAQVDALCKHLAVAYRPGVSREHILLQLQLDLDLLRTILEDTAQLVDDHSIKLAAHEPATERAYRQIATIIHALRNAGTIADKEQALVTAKIINTLTNHIEKLLAQQSQFDLPLAESNLKKYGVNIQADLIRARKSNSNEQELARLQAELETLNQAANNLAKINRPLATLQWLKTAKYDPRAIFLRWYLGVKREQQTQTGK